MNRVETKNPRPMALFLLGCLLFNYPFLELFNLSLTLFGVPLLYTYIFICWAALIGLMALVVEAHDEPARGGRAGDR